MAHHCKRRLKVGQDGPLMRSLYSICLLNQIPEFLFQMKFSHWLFPFLLALALFGCSDSKTDSNSVSTTASQASKKASAPQDALPPIPIEFIMDSALNGNVEAISLALEAGIDPNIIDENGRTPLMLAAFNGHTEIAERLLEAGARLDLRDSTNRTAFMFACTGSNLKLITILHRRGAGVNDIDSHESWTPLMFAAAEGHQDVVQYLLDNNADPNAADVDGETAAMFAQSRGFPEVAAMIQTRMK